MYVIWKQRRKLFRARNGVSGGECGEQMWAIYSDMCVGEHNKNPLFYAKTNLKELFEPSLSLCRTFHLLQLKLWTQEVAVPPSFLHPQPCPHHYPPLMAAVDSSCRWHRVVSIRPSGPGMSHWACLQSSSGSQCVPVFPYEQNQVIVLICGHRGHTPCYLLVCWWPLGYCRGGKKLLWTACTLLLDMYQ